MLPADWSREARPDLRRVERYDRDHPPRGTRTRACAFGKLLCLFGRCGGVIVGAAAIDGNAVVYLVDQFSAPYAIALNRSTGAVVWKSAPFAPPLTSSAAQDGSYTNSSPLLANGFIVAGYSPPEGEPT